MKVAEPQAEHAWLGRLVGEWTFEAVAEGEGEAGEQRATGTETVRSVGGLWVVAEGEGEMPGGGPAQTIMTLGFDPVAGHFTGTWIGSMMTHLWVYRGELDEARAVLALEAEGPSMAGDGTTATYRDAIEMIDDDHRVLRASVRADDGGWREFMVAHYRRR